MTKIQMRFFAALAVAMLFPSIGQTQMLRGDKDFPILNELNWKMSMQDVGSICQKSGVLESSKDSSMILTISFFGSPTRTEIQFDETLKQIKRVQAKFKEPTKTLEDTLVKRLTTICGMAPYKTSKEKNLLIVRIRVQAALWKTPTEIVTVLTGLSGEELIDLSLVLHPPTIRQQKTDNQEPAP